MDNATAAALSWWQILYRYSIFEAADSGWSLIIVSTYFGTFLQVVLKEPGADFGWAVTLAALIIAVISPLLGAAADASGRRQPYLRFFVFGVVLCTRRSGLDYYGARSPAVVYSGVYLRQWGLHFLHRNDAGSER